MSMEGDQIHPCDLKRRVGAELLCTTGRAYQTCPDHIPGPTLVFIDLLFFQKG